MTEEGTRIRRIVGPFNRVEGDLEVALEIEEGRVVHAEVVSTLFRGFERILVGKAPLDALTITPRICGICSISQSAAAARALGDLAGLRPPPQGMLAIQIIHGVENLVDHLTHFYMFFMPDFTRPDHAGRPWHEAATARFGVGGPAQRAWLETRGRIMHVMGILAGKWPHTLAIQPAGVSRAPDARDRLKLVALIRRLRRWLDETLFGDTAEAFSALRTSRDLSGWRKGDAGRYLAIADDLGLGAIGAGPGLWLSYGAHETADGPLFARGVRRIDDAGRPGELEPLDTAAILEDPSHAWDAGRPAHPSVGDTLPDPDREGAYSWCKAPRLAGRPAETGAFARQVVDGHPLALELAANGGSVHARIVGRLLEVARLADALERWALALEPRSRFIEHGPMPRDGRGEGLVEAARGALGHWVSLENGRIRRYQIIAPTTWNFSPRDASGQPGPLEQALVGCPGGVMVQHVVRSFDPCMVCTVH